MKMEMMVKKRTKGQSAMEYLMTYGWAILIIAVVLVVLYKLGVFSGASFLGTTCVANAGFLCSSPTYFGGTGIGSGTGGNVLSPTPAGNLLVTLGQSTGSTMYNVAFGFAVSGSSLTSSGVPNVPFLTYSNAITGNTLYSGATVTLTINATGGTTTPIGTSASGNLWIAYTTTSANPSSGATTGCGAQPTSTGVNAIPVANCIYQSIATLTLKAT
jgi:hypothetical protein